MLQLEPGEGREPLYLDASGLCDFDRCEARYCFRHVMGLMSESHPAPDYGTSLHAVCPLLKRGMLPEALAKFEVIWSSFGHEDDGKRNMINAEKMLRHYMHEEYSSEPYVLIEPPKSSVLPKGKDGLDTVSDDEFAFCLDIDGPIPIAGRIDAVGRLTTSGKIWNIEYKTTSETGARFISGFDPNPQILTYNLATCLLMPDEEIEGSFIEGFRVSKTKPNFVRIPVIPNEFQIEEHHTNMVSAMERIIQNWKTCQWKRQYTGCSSYPSHHMPGYNCEYLLLCKHANWREFLPAFNVEYWTPFEELQSGAS